MKQNMNSNHYRWEILKKEIELNDGTIKNLDDLIHKSKNFAWLMWSGSLFLIAVYLKDTDVDQQLLILCTAIIPLLFWIMDFQWRKHLRYASEREKIISKFINSDSFLKIMQDQGVSQFPILDPVGWIYTKQSKEAEVMHITKKIPSSYLINRKKFSFLQIAFYKDAGYYFLTMIIISLVFGGLYG